MLKKWFAYIVILAGTIVFYGVYEGYISHLLLTVTVFFPFFSLIISIYGMLRVRISLLPLPLKVKKGKHIDAVIRIDTRCRLPVSLIKITYKEINRTFCPEAKSRTVFLNDCVDSKYCLPLDTTHMGCLDIEFTKIRIYDYSGLFCFFLKLPEKKSIIVMPTLIRPKPMPVLPMDKIGGKGLKPKPGGGFAEDYDLREYRIGDPLNMLHWKLSAKLDELIVKEPLISEKGKIYICFNLFGSPDELDSIFGQIFYISLTLLQRMIEFSLCWYGQDGKLKIVEIKEKADFLRFIAAIFSAKLAKTGKAIDKYAFRQADWHYIVRPIIQEADNE